jgi:hypothetical protein
VALSFTEDFAMTLALRRSTFRSTLIKGWRLRSLVVVGMLVMTSTAWLAARKPAPSGLAEMIRTGVLVAQVNDVPSHNGRFRATLRPELTARGELADWRVLVETTDNKAPVHPALVMRSSMPEVTSVMGDRPRTLYLGDGTFRVDGLRFNRPGWWNVSVTISDAGVTDSLAFNLIVP